MNCSVYDYCKKNYGPSLDLKSDSELAERSKTKTTESLCCDPMDTAKCPGGPFTRVNVTTKNPSAVKRSTVEGIYDAENRYECLAERDCEEGWYGIPATAPSCDPGYVFTFGREVLEVTVPSKATPKDYAKCEKPWNWLSEKKCTLAPATYYFWYAKYSQWGKYSKKSVHICDRDK